LIIEVKKLTSSTEEGHGNTATSNTTREDIMKKASTLTQNQRSATVAAASMGGALIPEKTKVVSAVTTRAGEKAADAATAKQGVTAASISEKSTTKEVVDNTAVEQAADDTSKKAVPTATSSSSSAFKRAKELNAKAKSERVQRVGGAVNSVLGSISNEVAAGILECFHASVSEAKQSVQHEVEKFGTVKEDLKNQINTLEQILADKELPPDSDYRLTKKQRHAEVKGKLEKLDADIVQIKKDELARLKKNYTELFKDAMMYHNKMNLFKMDQSEVVKLKKEWEENLAKTTWEHL